MEVNRQQFSPEKHRQVRGASGTGKAEGEVTLESLMNGWDKVQQDEEPQRRQTPLDPGFLQRLHESAKRQAKDGSGE